jgi:hypothetical protein
MVATSAGLRGYNPDSHHPSGRRLLVARSFMKNTKDEIETKYCYHELICEQIANVSIF